VDDLDADRGSTVVTPPRVLGLLLVLAMGCGGARPSAAEERSSAAISSSGGSASSTASRPRTPGRADVVTAMMAVSPEVGECLRDAGGAVTIRIEVASDGAITSATALAPDPTHVHEVDIRGTDVERCAASALRATRLPPFENETFVFAFPFRPR
jgi:hypothetical protein